MSGKDTHTIESFDPATMPLDGIRLIEASAGTGKTFSLAGLYLRLIVEKQLDVREILVMTFTRAATQELRERLRARLAMATRVAAEAPRADRTDAAEDFAERVIANADADRATVAARLRDAATRVDQATITTIHGFAQRAAGENAFESALPFDRGEQVEDAEIQREAAADYWRARVFGQPAQQAGAFVSLWASPEALYQDIRDVLGKPHAHLIRPDGAAVERDRKQALKQWTNERDAFIATLDEALEHGGLLAGSSLKTQLEAEGSEAIAAAIDAGLAGTSDGFPALPAVLADLGDEEGVRKHAKKAAMKWLRPQDLGIVPILARLQINGRMAAVTAAIDAIRTLTAQRKRERRLFSYNDMILGLHQAVTDPEGGPALAAALRRTWPWALVDEFQDTDPLQYEILQRIYGDEALGIASLNPTYDADSSDQDPVGWVDEGNPTKSPADTTAQTPRSGGLILIGDPKQAIYGFRGGDVFAYLDAANDAHGRYGMDTNFRSTGAVLNGVGAVFEAGGEDAFVLEGIDFRPVKPGRNEGDLRLEHDGAELPGVTAWSIPEDAGTSKGEVQKRIERATVERIVTLLEEGAFVTAEGQSRDIRPSEIAVLVNSNREAATMQSALGEANVPAVCIHQDSVFTHEAAHDLLQLLRAAASPFDAQRLRVALTTALFGYRMGDLVALDEDEHAWSEATHRFQEAHVRWSQTGVQAMLEPLLQEAAARVVALTDGDRRITDFLHVADLLQRAEHEVFGMEGLVHWLENAIRRADDGEVGDTDRVRLADDAELVQVTTVHKAKGLQFPVVFVPYSPWLGTGGAKPTEPPLAFHDENNQAVVDLGSDTIDEHTGQAVRERRAEQVRSLYVALTRAEQACFFVHGAANNAIDGPLAWLLHKDDGVTADGWHGGKKLPEWFNAASTNKRLGELAKKSHGTLKVEPLPDPPRNTPLQTSTATRKLGPARSDLPAPRTAWSVFSFSRLAGRMTAPTEPTAGADDETTTATLPVGLDESGDIADEVITYPRGAGFGKAFHDIVEATSFDAWPKPAAELDGKTRDAVREKLRRNGVATVDADNAETPVDDTARMIAAALHAPLPEIGPLAAIPETRRRNEMEFFMRLGGSQAGAVLEAMAAAGYEGARGTSAITSLRGLMHGFIDLVVEHEGRYWILDYKTNALGRLRADYAHERLAEAMAEHHYDLQYLIYTVALHRHLRQRLPGYDPHEHLGGVQYLFVRALDENGENGVFSDQPDPTLVERLDALFDGSAAA
ncbi:UvrD-helicase domain-containing protein [Halofilum ochraceum]|uniref:UvrD-helicase domain-containing protein n=1 Tax=Halofilum ochraceum TaxID=1611323 RepID=UPI0008DB0625|nr:UvrD-helicase domain-containing protein [Halofilum ochraceum]